MAISPKLMKQVKRQVFEHQSMGASELPSFVQITGTVVYLRVDSPYSCEHVDVFVFLWPLLGSRHLPEFLLLLGKTHFGSEQSV